MGPASLTFVCEVSGPPDCSTLIAAGHTQHACAGPDGKPVRVPDWLRELLGA